MTVQKFIAYTPLDINGQKLDSQQELTLSILETSGNYLLHKDVLRHFGSQRQGTVSTKTRSEVRGGGRKPWRQKGRGTARAGTIRSPIWIGGGTIFGPKPRNYRQKLNKKVRQIARKSALSVKAKSEQIYVIEDFNFDAPKTNELAGILDALALTGKKTLLLTNELQTNVYKSGKNIPKVNVLEADKASTYDLLNSQILLLQKGAIEKLESTFN